MCDPSLTVACWSGGEASSGRVLVVGSAAMWDDAWLGQEDNARLADWAFSWLCMVRTSRWACCLVWQTECRFAWPKLVCLMWLQKSQDPRLQTKLPDATMIMDGGAAHLRSDTESLADQPKPCMQVC